MSNRSNTQPTTESVTATKLPRCYLSCPVIGQTRATMILTQGTAGQPQSGLL
jgi:hypothetical protein